MGNGPVLMGCDCSAWANALSWRSPFLQPASPAPAPFLPLRFRPGKAIKDVIVTKGTVSGILFISIFLLVKMQFAQLPLRQLAASSLSIDAQG